MSENAKSEGWWHTVPGLLTALAGIITAVAGLLVALYQVGFFAKKAVPIEEPISDNVAVISELTCRETGPLGDRWGISYWDLDSDRCIPYQEPVAGADFIFKPVYPEGENTKFGVIPYHGARFAPLQQGRPPWEVSLSEFTQDRTHVVPTRAKYPCLTNRGTLCQFEIIVRNNYVYVSVLLFKKK